MAEDTAKAGTPNPDDGEAAKQPKSGTQGEDGRDARGSDDTAKLNMEWKQKAERVNALEAEVAELKARQEQSPAARDDAATDKIEELLEEAAGFARKGDATSALLLRERAERLQFQQDVIHANQIRDIPLDERAEVTAHFQKNRHRFADPLGARSELREKALAKRNVELEAEVRRLGAKPDEDVVKGQPVSTKEREVTATENTKHMTAKQWEREQKTLSPLERMARQRAHNEGKIVVDD